MRKICSFLLLLIITVVLGYCTFSNIFSDKIVFEGFGKYVSMSSNAEIQDIVSEEEIETLQITVVGKSDFYFDVGEYRELTMEEADKIQTLRREAGSSYFKDFNKKLYENMPQYNYKNVYVSKYFPQIVVDVNSEDVLSRKSNLLNDLASIDMVDKVYVHNKIQKQEYLADAYDVMNVTDEICDGTLTGYGVKVGVLDGGIIDVNNPNFEDINVETRDAWYYIETVSDHATTMASCIGGKEGIAREAMIYSVECAGNASSELDWLIDNGVNIVNCSYGYGDENGIYSSHSATYDYMIWTYGISVIAASGNEKSNETDYLMPNPALTHNAITVGGAHSYNIAWDGSCYQEVTEVDKPTLINAADNIQTSNATRTGSGTSYSCALTTGCAALLMEQCPNLKVYPAKLTAILCAGTYPTAAFYDLTSGLSDEVGCGTVDFKNSREAVGNIAHTRTLSSDEEGDYLISHEVPVMAGQTITVAASWLGKSNDSVDSWQLTNYVLCLFRPTGAQVEVQYSLYNNVLLIRHEAEQTGYYEILLIQEGDLAFTDPTYIFISYYVWPES